MINETPEYLRLANRTTTETYRKEFTDEELVKLRAEFVAESYELSLVEAEMKQQMDEFKEEIKAKKEVVKRLLPIVRNGYEIVTGDVRPVYNDEEGIVEFYDPNSSDLVGSRKQKAEERLSLFTKE